ncbi:hypothetical protein [Bremerella sp. P1]|uniref:hypothetical protein n=1 Tax=Bremerella sp. P1 TaxID=3026424 RepID=UPI002367C434|nr:hypothetical protein [Bremerella sp. P1]WDI39740.1 hypothetical protein PSR63_14720 [Bremerella sp. P1]
MVTRFSLCFLLVGLLLSLGCTAQSNEPQRLPVSGSVSLDGKPLDKGVIYFKTVSKGSVDALDIVAGKFSGEVEPGERRVEISAFRTASGGTPGMDAGEVNYIPAKYNNKSTLKANVTQGQANEFDFAVTSK